MTFPAHTDPPVFHASDLGELTGTAAVPEVPCPDLPCAECGLGRLLDPTGGWLACGNPDCPNLAILAPLWRELDAAVAAGAVDLCPAGWPRPRHPGPQGDLPVPWLTPVTRATGPLWTLVHGRRLAHAQEQWVCQVCGEPCGRQAFLVVDEAGRCRTSAPLHDRCAELALAVCPDLTQSSARAVTATRDDVVAEGDTDLALGLTTRWRVEPRTLPSPSAPVPRTAASRVARSRAK